MHQLLLVYHEETLKSKIRNRMIHPSIKVWGLRLYMCVCSWVFSPEFLDTYILNNMSAFCLGMHPDTSLQGKNCPHLSNK